ncbi:profilin [Plakobranchus ocellatus]|uniref:Profilin n=1 Tax=Plakobranchus ocellatus TaxID=259542 RepID=A0AAV3Z7F0_9GAST|nr:profilin [Plakobranchus ocellatus]
MERSAEAGVLAASGHQRSYGSLNAISNARPIYPHTQLEDPIQTPECASACASKEIIIQEAQSPRMLELMTWSEIIENLQQEGNLKMAAVFDERCQQLAVTDGAMLSSEDAFSITHIMDSPSTMIYGLFLGGNKFSCLTVDQNTLIGHAGEDVFVAFRNRNLLICAVAGLSTQVSCLGTIKNFVGRLVAEGAPDVTVPSLM